MNILITGGAGFLGTTLVKRLYSKPVVFDNLMYDQGPLVYNTFNINRIEFYKEDIRNWSDDLKTAIEKADVIIPLAAYVGAPLCDRFTYLSKATNYEWFLQLLHFLREDQLIIYPNTNSSYGTQTEICTEETEVNPISHYAKTKQLTEELLLKKHKNTIVYRLATVFGWSPRPRLDLLINALTYEAVKTKKIKVFDGHYNRNYIHIQDIASAFIFAIENRDKMVGQVFNLGNDSLNMSKLELAKCIGALTNADIEINNTQTDSDKRNYLVSSQKLYNLGFKCKYSLEDGVTEIVNFSKLVTDPNARFLRNY